MPESDAANPADVIAAALSRLRGRRGPRPPWSEGGSDEPGWRHGGGPHGGDPHGFHGHGPGPGGHRGMFPGARFAGGPARLRLLEALTLAAEPLSVSELAERIGVDQPRASRLVQQCADAGLVRREADPDDARRTRIVLTDDGRAVASGFRGERLETVRSALAGFSDAEAAELARLLTRFAEAWPQR